MWLGNIYYKILTMMRVFIANAKTEERSALRFMLLNLKLEVVGDASDWQTTLVKAPATNFNLLLVDWNLLPANAAAGLSRLIKAAAAIRRVCNHRVNLRQSRQDFEAVAQVESGVADNLPALPRLAHATTVAHPTNTQTQ